MSHPMHPVLLQALADERRREIRRAAAARSTPVARRAPRFARRAQRPHAGRTAPAASAAGAARCAVS